MNLYPIAFASLLALPLAGCNSVPSNCKDLAISILNNSYQDAPKNQGVYIRRIHLSKMPNGTRNFMGIAEQIYSFFVISIDNSGQIDEKWWSHSSQENRGVNALFEDSSNTSIPVIPEPDMKTSDGIVCKVWGAEPSSDKDTESEGYILQKYGATLTQDKESYQVKY